ncbi:MAG: MFS transporter [Thermoplasmata archaeon]
MAESRIDRRVYFLGLSRFIRAMGRTSSFIFLPVILFELYGMSLIEIGIFSGTATLIMAFFQYYSGKLTDKIGRRKFLIYIPIPVAISYFTMFIVIYRNMNAYFLILLWYSTVVLNALQFPAIQASVADVTDLNQRLKGFTIVRLFVNTGAAVGPLIGAFVGSINFSYIYLVTSVASVVELVVLFFAINETYTPPKEITRRTIRGTLKSSYFLLFFSIVGLIFSFLLRQRGTTFTLFIYGFEHISLIELGFIYSINGILVVALQYPIFSFMQKKMNFLYWRSVGSMIYSLSFFMIILISGFYGYMFIMGVMTVGEDFVSPTTETIITSVASYDSRGTYIGTYNMITSFGNFLGSVFGLYYLSVFRKVPDIFWEIMAGGLFIVAIMYFMIYPYYKREINISENRNILLVE